MRLASLIKVSDAFNMNWIRNSGMAVLQKEASGQSIAGLNGWARNSRSSRTQLSEFQSAVPGSDPGRGTGLRGKVPGHTGCHGDALSRSGPFIARCGEDRIAHR